MSGSSYWPRSAVNAYGTAPFSRIHASAQQVSSPPENAIPTRSPTGSEPRMRAVPFSVSVALQVAREVRRELARARAVAQRDEDRVVARHRSRHVGEARFVDRVR